MISSASFSSCSKSIWSPFLSCLLALRFPGGGAAGTAELLAEAESPETGGSPSSSARVRIGDFDRLALGPSSTSLSALPRVVDVRSLASGLAGASLVSLEAGAERGGGAVGASGVGGGGSCDLSLGTERFGISTSMRSRHVVLCFTPA